MTSTKSNLDAHIAIIAGGVGSRLKKVTGSLPKALIELGGQNNLARIIGLSKRYGFSRVSIFGGVAAANIKRFVEVEYPNTKNIEVIAEKKQLGTASKCKSLCYMSRDPLIVIYGDIICNFSLKNFLSYHYDKGGDATILVQHNSHYKDSDIIDFDKHYRVTNIYRKPHPTNLSQKSGIACAAAYIVNSSIAEHILQTPCDWVHDVFPKAIESGKIIYAYHSIEYLHDFGTPRRLTKAQWDLKNGILNCGNSDNGRAAVEIDLHNQSVDCRPTMKIFKILNYYRMPIIALTDEKQKWEICLKEQGIYADLFVKNLGNNQLEKLKKEHHIEPELIYKLVLSNGKKEDKLIDAEEFCREYYKYGNIPRYKY
tara:strand:+ start:596 stop:1702 length:1107 start_codon:yes stop_codon:yes gene_type:complete